MNILRLKKNLRWDLGDWLALVVGEDSRELLSPPEIDTFKWESLANGFGLSPLLFTGDSLGELFFVIDIPLLLPTIEIPDNLFNRFKPFPLSLFDAFEIDTDFGSFSTVAPCESDIPGGNFGIDFGSLWIDKPDGKPAILVGFVGLG